MAGRLFLDANVLVYAYDRAELEKQRRAVDLLEALRQLNEGVLSTQTLGEFFRAITRRIRYPLTPGEALTHLRVQAEAWDVLLVTGDTLLEAARGSDRYQLAYWDAQIWAAARLNGIPVVLSEDFQNGREIEGVRFLNPFDPSFDLDEAVASVS